MLDENPSLSKSEEFFAMWTRVSILPGFMRVIFRQDIYALRSTVWAEQKLYVKSLRHFEINFHEKKSTAFRHTFSFICSARWTSWEMIIQVIVITQICLLMYHHKSFWNIVNNKVEKKDNWYSAFRIISVFGIAATKYPPYFYLALL